VGKAKDAVWDGYAIVWAQKNHKVSSWMYDAASILDIVLHDEQMIKALDDYYANPGKLPWN
jgi:hypothetical protein